MIDRLTGGSNNNKVAQKPPMANSSSNKQIGRANNAKASMSAPKKDNAKDILNKMK